MEGGDRCSEMAGHLGGSNQSSTQASSKLQVVNDSAENALVGPSNLAMEGLECSMPESLQAHTKPPLAIEIQESVARPSSCQEYDASCDGSNLQTLFKIMGQNLPSSNTSLERNGNDLPLFKFRNKHSGESSGESGLDLTNETSAEVYPSFQFFVRADEGINLFVDLSSSPSDWVTKLKYEVCIYQNPQKNSWSISNGIKETGNVEEHLKISYSNEMEPSKDTSTASQLNELGAKDRCMVSTLKPIVGLNCNFAVSSDGIYGNSPAKALACNHDNKEHTESLVKGNRTISFLEVTCSDMKHCGHVCPEGSVEKHDHISSLDNGCHTSLPDGSSVTNLDRMNDSADTIRVDVQDPSDRLTIEANNIASRVMILRSPANLLCRVCGQSTRTMETTATNITQGINYTKIQGMRRPGSKESFSLPNYSCVCRSLENSASRNAAPASTDDPGTVTPLLEDNAFELPDIRSSQLTRNKRLRNSSTFEENSRKKQCDDAGHQNDPIQRFRSLKSPDKEQIFDSSIQPRRSTRLVSK